MQKTVLNYSKFGIPEEWCYIMDDRFEKSFGEFLERKEYDEASSAMFALTRSAFLAGWRAAGGGEPGSQPTFEIIEFNRKKK